MIKDQDPDVPARLLAAAATLFAERGFDDVTTREIAAAAGVNLACINYHFDGKAGLYRETLLAAHRGAMARLPPPAATPEERLRDFIRTVVGQVLGRDQMGMRLLARELANPTAALAEVVDRSIRPSAERLRGIIRELLGPAGDPETVRHCAVSVIGQCLHWHHGRPVISRLYPDEPFDAERIAGHIADFTIAGLHALAARPRSQP